MNKLLDQFKSMGEEKLGQLAAKLLANEKFVQGVQVLVSKSLEAKELMDRNVQTMLGAMGLPTSEEYRSLLDRFDQVEADLDSLKERVAALEQAHKPKTKSKARKKTASRR